MMFNDFWEAGHKFFGLNGAENGKCNCGNPNCKALYKHPIASNWQHTPYWSEEQIETMQEMGQLDTGYGVLVSDGLFIVDIDSRNGGVKSYEKLVQKIPEIAAAGFIVNTGSGKGSKHLYFTIPTGVSLLQHVDDYPGIDFKSSGFVVGPGSMHASGSKYEAVVGGPADIEPAPQALIDLLLRPESHRASINGAPVDVSDETIVEMLSHISPDCDHETWYRVGMAIHHSTSGAGLNLWDEWSKDGETYPGIDVLDHRWQSFGKSTNPVTLGTLLHYAEKGGYSMPVEFESAAQFICDEHESIDTSLIDLRRPPGFVGEVAAWIDSQCVYPRRSLCVAAALMTVSDCGGMRYFEPVDNISLNLFAFGVADSASGKNAVLSSHQKLLQAAGLSKAVVGGIKSEQEIYRNLLRHQAAFYVMDELGEQIARLASAKKKGGASYLEGVVGTLMSVYSQANGFALITGDLKDDIEKQLRLEAAKLQKKIDNNEDVHKSTKRLNRVLASLSNLDMGIEAPFLSIFGLTAPEVFESLMTRDMVMNGFMGRTIIFKELDGNPRPRKVTPAPVPENIRQSLINLYAPGYAGDMERVERMGSKEAIQSTDGAISLLARVAEEFWEMAEQHKETTGMHPIPRRGYEQVAKISAILGMPSGLRTEEHVLWAYALIKSDLDGKLKMAWANSADDEGSAINAKILSCVSKDHGETIGRIINKCRPHKKADIVKGIDFLRESGVLVTKPSTASRGPKKEWLFLA